MNTAWCHSEPAYGTAGIGVCFQGSSCAFFGAPMPKEKVVSVSIKDDLGTDVYASVIQDTNEDGNLLATDDLTVNICGATTEPVERPEVQPGPRYKIEFFVWKDHGTRVLQYLYPSGFARKIKADGWPWVATSAERNGRGG